LLFIGVLQCLAVLRCCEFLSVENWTSIKHRFFSFFFLKPLSYRRPESLSRPDAQYCLIGYCTDKSLSRHLHFRALPYNTIYGNGLYWRKYIRDFDGATQWLKVTVPDRWVWLTKPACVIVAMRFSKALRRAIKGTKQSARPCGLLLLKIALKKSAFPEKQRRQLPPRLVRLWC